MARASSPRWDGALARVVPPALRRCHRRAASCHRGGGRESVARAAFHGGGVGGRSLALDDDRKMWTADATDGVRSRRPRRARLKARGSDRFDDADDAAADDDDDARAWLNEESIGEAGSVLLLVLMSILYGSAVPVFYDPTAAAAWRLTPGLHTFTRSFIAAALLAPAFVFLPPAPASARRGGAIDPGRVARFGVEFGVVVFLATFAQWKHADNVAPESFFLALALAPVLAVVSRRGVPGAEVPSDVPTSKFEKGAATQVGVAILGMLVLVSDQDTDVLFEPWGVAAAVLVTSLIVRSEVLVARESLTAKARIAAVQTATTATLAAAWAASDVVAAASGSSSSVITDAFEALSSLRLPLGQLAYLGVLTGVVSACELVAINKYTQGYAMLAFGLIPVTGAGWQWLAGGDGVSLAEGIGSLSWGEVIALATAAPPSLLFFLTRRTGVSRREAEGGGDGKDGAVGAVGGVFSRLLGGGKKKRGADDGHDGHDDDADDARDAGPKPEGIMGSVVGNLLKNPWWATKVSKSGALAGGKGALKGVGALKAGKGVKGASLLAKAVVGESVVGAVQTGVTGLIEGADIGEAVMEAEAVIEAVEAEGLAGAASTFADGVVASVDGLMTESAASVIASQSTSATVVGVGGVSAGGVSAKAAGGAAAKIGGGLALKAGAAAVAGASAVVGYTSTLPGCAPGEYETIRAAAAQVDGVAESMAAAAAAAADIPVCSVDPGALAELVSDGLNAIGIDVLG